MTAPANRIARMPFALLALAGVTAAFAPAGPIGTGSSARETAILAGGCFWGVEAVYRHVKGVKSAVSGYAVPVPRADTDATNRSEPSMHTSHPGYVEAVRITYDPSELSYQQVLKVFFAVAHDPTQLDRQGPDIGPEYRSAILWSSDAQRQAAESYIAELRSAGTFERPVVTEVVALKSFREAEDLHQDYVARHPDEPYVVLNDAPKLEHLKRQFPELYRK